jgi:hypothetical protein
LGDYALKRFSEALTDMLNGLRNIASKNMALINGIFNCIAMGPGKSETSMINCVLQSSGVKQDT